MGCSCNLSLKPTNWYLVFETMPDELELCTTPTPRCTPLISVCDGGWKQDMVPQHCIVDHYSHLKLSLLDHMLLVYPNLGQQHLMTLCLIIEGCLCWKRVATHRAAWAAGCIWMLGSGWHVQAHAWHPAGASAVSSVEVSQFSAVWGPWVPTKKE